MNSERVRSLLGVWAPMAIGLLIIVTAVNFYFTARLTGGLLVSNLESWRLVCSVGAFFVGGVMILSTYGRYMKTKEARREFAGAGPVAAPPEPTEQDREESGPDQRET